MVNEFSDQLGDLGSGASRGGGGRIRKADGSFGERAAAQEEQYFRKLQHEQLAKLKQQLDAEKINIFKNLF